MTPSRRPSTQRSARPDSDANDLEGTNPNAADYIGKHPGNAFMELQFYGPGYVPQFEGFGCTATQYCAAMTIDSLSSNQNNGVDNNAACNDYILGGVEPINWAYITKSGQSQAPANPLFTGTFDNPNFAAVNPDLNKDLFMNPGDRIRMHCTTRRRAFELDLIDLTTGQSGSMTASTANGFAHILYQPNASNCKAKPYAFHPEYSTGTPRGNTWSAHTYNIAMSDEIGHFENCEGIDASRQLHDGRALRTRRWTVTTSAASRLPTRRSFTSTGASPPTGTSTGSPTGSTGPGPIPTRSSTVSCTRRR